MLRRPGRRRHWPREEDVRQQEEGPTRQEEEESAVGQDKDKQATFNFFVHISSKHRYSEFDIYLCPIF